MKNLSRRGAMAVSSLALLIGLGIAPAAASADVQVAACTVNHYRVNSTPAAVWTWPGGNWLRDKQAGDHVTGPNSNVMRNYYDGWRIVYLGGGGVGQMWANYLDYSWCE